MASDENTCLFTGRISRINDLGEGKPMYVGLAVNNYKGAERGEEPAWLDLVVFNGQKAVFNQGYASVGRQVIVRAQAETRQVEVTRPDGQASKMTQVNFVVQKLTLGAPKREDSGNGASSPAPAPAAAGASTVPQDSGDLPF